VRLATHADFEEFVRQHGLDFYPIEASGQALQGSEMGDRMLRAGGNPFAFMREFTRLRQPLVPELMSNCWEASADADLILLSPTALFIGLSVAERRGLPTCWTALQPAAPSRFQGNFFFPEAPRWLPLPGLYNLLTHVLAGETLWQFMRPVLNQARREVLDLPPWPLWGPLAEMRRPSLRLYGYSPLVVPPPADWGDHHHVTGYWFLDAPSYRPDPDLEEFLAAGPPPVYIGFGSNHNRDAAEVTEMVLKVLARTGQRGVLHTGWGGLMPVPRSERVFPVNSVPHSWLFPRMAVIVHHGGAGTTGAALRAGVPTLVVPFTSDQPFWGRRVAALGAGPTPIPRRQLTAERLEEGIRIAVTDEGMRQQAARVGAAIRAEQGVERAVELFNRSYGGKGRPRSRTRLSEGREQRARARTGEG